MFYERAEAHNFVDIQALAERFDLAQLTDIAGQLDSGFTSETLAESLASHQRFFGEEFRALGRPLPAARRDRWLTVHATKETPGPARHWQTRGLPFLIPLRQEEGPWRVS